VVTPFGEVVRGPRGKSEIAITFDALPAIIANLQGRGFKLVTISALLGSAANPR
jgi:polysaccharide deacetylase 2 family uncharacterized protein YibQ